MKDYYEHIDDYLGGQLSAADRQEFEHAMSRDNQLLQAVEDHDVAMSLLDGLIEVEVRSVLEEEDEEIEPASNEGSSDVGRAVEGRKEGSGAQKKRSRIGKLPTWVWISLVAVACLFFIKSFFTVIQPNSSEIQYADIYQEPNWPIQRGANNSATSEAITYYLEGSKLEAIEQLEAMNTDDSHYWLSELYFKEKQWSKVGESIQKISALPSNTRRDKLNYLEIMSLYFDGKIEQARSKAQQLPADTDSYYLEIFNRI